MILEQIDPWVQIMQYLYEKSTKIKISGHYITVCNFMEKTVKTVQDVVVTAEKSV